MKPPCAITLERHAQLRQFFVSVFICNLNGFDDAAAQMVALNLNGNSSLGPVQVSLSPTPPSLGIIEEQANNVFGVLDIPPFTPSGTAKSFFDLYFQILIGPNILRNIVPIRMTGIIAHKPPGPGNAFSSTNPGPVPLVDAFGQPSPIQFLAGVLVPNCIPPKVSVAQTANGKLTLCWPALCGTAFQVQCASNLLPPINWQAVTYAITNTNDQYCVTVDITAVSRFYRVVR